ncbi:MAG: glyoxylate/hydroxypyruvate reductase A [Actinomycetota bacterium]|nr:glyoxylate/hydroxypyruvate reductase A [Actinomycetota bacterium]
MAVLLHPEQDHEEWRDAFRRELPEVEFRFFDEIDDRSKIEYAVVSRHGGELGELPNLEAILAMGAGVEQFTGPGLPEVPVVRLVDQGMSDEMATYALSWVAHFQRRHDAFIELQAAGQWVPLPYTPAADYPVGILGMGNIGRTVAELFAKAGYPVHAWTRGGGADDWVTHFAGPDELDGFLGSVKAVVNVLPSTNSTAGLMDRARFSAMDDDAIFLNMGRGATVAEADLVAAIDAAELRHAVLDVTAVEPLPASSPLWSHPKITITPHVAGYTLIPSASKVIAANIRRLMNGEQPFPLYERDRDY